VHRRPQQIAGEKCGSALFRVGQPGPAEAYFVSLIAVATGMNEVDLAALDACFLPEGSQVRRGDTLAVWERSFLSPIRFSMGRGTCSIITCSKGTRR
ncbi:MAG: hypothetical protein KAJ12_14610, partial [Bacteroidetes bacterium]|nr:hypothetical protein [Bacteroidota bacterium]